MGVATRTEDRHLITACSWRRLAPQLMPSCFRTQPTCNARYGKYLHTPGTARFQLIWRFWNWDSRHAECLLPEGSLRRRLNIGTRQTMRTATDRYSLLTGIRLHSNHPVHARLVPDCQSDSRQVEDQFHGPLIKSRHHPPERVGRATPAQTTASRLPQPPCREESRWDGLLHPIEGASARRRHRASRARSRHS